jgi:hypothetical protein
LNGKGNTSVTVQNLIESPMRDLMLGAVQQEQLFEESIVESMSKIFYGKDSIFIKKRIKKIKKIFTDSDNALFLGQLIDKKLEYSQIIDPFISQYPILTVVRNEFFMKSNVTFHGAAMEQIKNHLVRYLSFIIFYLE